MISDDSDKVEHYRSDTAYRMVSDLIRKRELRGGEVIVEVKLADMLGVSRTPLREALQRLEGERLIVKNGGRSFVVRHVDLDASAWQVTRQWAASRRPAPRMAAHRRVA